ncbi:MAG: 30S ribosomal protein S16 [Myxococcota bacterium]
MVRIRLARAGGKKKPYYRIVATDERNPRDGRFIEQVGIYDPLKSPALVRLDLARVDHWLGHGAQPSQTVKQLLRRTRAAAPPAA